MKRRASMLLPDDQSPEKWLSCRDAFYFTWKNDPDHQIGGLSRRNRWKLAHSMGFCPHLRCQLGNLSAATNQRRGDCPQGLCFSKLENGSPSFGACCFINGSFDSGDIFGDFDRSQATAKPIYNHSRIILSDKETLHEDIKSPKRFINANRVHPQVILTQCPMRGTLSDVKRMIVQEEISLWIQLTSKTQLTPLHDPSSSRLDCYLLPESWSSSSSGEVRVVSDGYHQRIVDRLSSSRSEELSPFRFTNFTLLSADDLRKERTVQHIWYKRWEDFTKPEETDYEALRFIASLTVSHLKAGQTIAINCFSGRGRSGTIAALILGQYRGISSQDELVDLIVSLREHRDGLVEIPSQYRFLSEMMQLQPPLLPPGMSHSSLLSSEEGEEVVASSLSSSASLSLDHYLHLISLLLVLLPLFFFCQRKMRI